MTLSENRNHQTVMRMVYLHQNSINTSVLLGKKFHPGSPNKMCPMWKNLPPICSFTLNEIDVATVHNDLYNLDGDSSNDVLQLDAKLLRMSAIVICRTPTHL